MKNIPEFSWIGCMHEGIPVATENLDACIKFYTEVLGLNILSRPKTLDEFGPGAWLGDKDDTVQFHLSRRIAKFLRQWAHYAHAVPGKSPYRRNLSETNLITLPSTDTFHKSRCARISFSFIFNLICYA